MQAHIHGLGFEECIEEVTLDQDQQGGSFSYSSPRPQAYRPRKDATVNIAVWDGPTFNATIIQVADNPGGSTTARFRRLPT
jgi:hypothetical protein